MGAIFHSTTTCIYSLFIANDACILYINISPSASSTASKAQEAPLARYDGAERERPGEISGYSSF